MMHSQAHAFFYSPGPPARHGATHSERDPLISTDNQYDSPQTCLQVSLICSPSTVISQVTLGWVRLAVTDNENIWVATLHGFCPHVDTALIQCEWIQWSSGHGIQHQALKPFSHLMATTYALPASSELFLVCSLRKTQVSLNEHLIELFLGFSGDVLAFASSIRDITVASSFPSLNLHV